MSPVVRERWTGRKAVDLDSEEQQRAYAGGYEPGPDGYMTGRDPRRMSPDDLEAMGHQRMSVIDALRRKCLDCAGSPNEVRLCVAVACPSWPFRTGKNPWRAPPSEAQLEASRRNALRMRSGASGPLSFTGSSAGTLSDDDE